MKNILKRRLIYLGLGATMLAPMACKDQFLEVPVTEQVTEDAITSPDGLKGLLVGTYSMLNGRGYGARYSGFSNWIWGSVRGGDANKGSDSGDQGNINPAITYSLQPTNPHVHEKWQATFEGVARANFLLASVANSEQLSDEEKAVFTAEGKFLRGIYYFELRKNFNKVPFVTEVVDYATGALEVPNDKEILPEIEADLQAAYAGLPETQSEVGRANKWAAAAYLAKVYMFQQKYAEAKPLFDAIIANGVTSAGEKYALVEDYGDLFRGEFENSAESVFAFQAAANTGSTNNTNQDYELNFPHNPEAPGGCCGFFQPSFELTNSFRTTEDGLPLLDGTYNLPANALKNDYTLKGDVEFIPDGGPLDPRLDHTVGRRGIPYIDWGLHPGFPWIRDQGFAGPYSPKKYVYAQSEIGVYQDGSSWTPGYTAMNFMLVRYADVLLMAAEAEVEVGSLAKALEYVNIVRERAANSKVQGLKGAAPAANYVVKPYDSFSDQDMARRAVRFERKLELAMEGHRFYDLLRWGVLDVAIPNYIAFEGKILTNQFSGAEWNSGRDEYLPVPQRQIDLTGSDILTQNPGY